MDLKTSSSANSYSPSDANAASSSARPKKTIIGFDIGNSAASAQPFNQNSTGSSQSLNQNSAGSAQCLINSSSTPPVDIDLGSKKSKDDLDVFGMSPLSRTAMRYTYSSPSDAAASPPLGTGANAIAVNCSPPARQISNSFVADRKKSITASTEAPLQAKREEKRPQTNSAKVSPLPVASEQQQSTTSKKPSNKERQEEKKQAKLAAASAFKSTQQQAVNASSVAAAAAAPHTGMQQVSLFSHLPEFEKDPPSKGVVSTENIHPAILRLALLYHDNAIVGANARCISMLEGFKQIIQEYKTPMNATLNRHLDAYLKPQINYLVHYRPLATSMGNAIRYLKCKIAELSPDMAEDHSKEYLVETIDLYIRNRIKLAGELIAQHGNTKINNGDVILTFARSETVLLLLKKAHESGKKFRVIVVDSRPLYEGKQTLEILAACGIQCTYTLIHAIGYVMKEVSKVFLGAHCVFSNGNLMSRVGSALVATIANDFNVPVCVTCETYKFSDRVQIDSFVYNEIGDPELLVNEVAGRSMDSRKILACWKEIPTLKLLNLMYDVTPAHNITVIVTEVGMLPCSSVPVVLREYRPYST